MFKVDIGVSLSSLEEYINYNWRAVSYTHLTLPTKA